jgi:hypothetical protein
MSIAVYVLNRCPTKSMDDMTLFQAWCGKKLTVCHLKTFGCIIYVRNTMPYLTKPKDCGCNMIILSYESGSKAYHAYDLVMKCVHVTRDVVFDEQAQWDWSTGGDNGELGSGDDVFTVEYKTIGQAAPETEGADEEPVEESPLPATDDNTEVHNDIDDDNLDTDHDNEEIDDDIDDDNLIADHDDDTSLRFCSINDILRKVEFASRALVEEELHVVSSDESASFAEAERSPS